MRKIISMLLAFSMSLSVMCSSFTVAAVDGNDTAAKTESAVPSNGTGFEGLFANEINEKVAEKSNDCGINSVEMSENTATVSYWSSKDCTVIVGIYEDDGTKGTHMVTFGTANVKAAESETSVRIDNLPQYFYLKAFIVDSESYRPLTVAYENSDYIYSGNDNEQTDIITDEEYEAMETVDENIQSLLNDAEYQSFDMEAKSEAMTALFERLQAKKLINEYTCPKPSNGELCRFEYACGVLGYTLLSGKFKEERQGTESYESGSYTDEFEYSNENIGSYSKSIDSNSGSAFNPALLPEDRELKIKIMVGHKGIDKWDRSDLTAANEKELEALGSGVSVKVDDKTTVKKLKNLKNEDYDIIVFFMHGGRLCEIDDKYDWIMVTNEKTSKFKTKSTYAEDLKGEKSVVFLCLGEKFYAVRPSFFTEYLQGINSKFIISLCCQFYGCSHGEDNAAAETVLNIPNSDIKAVTGFCNSVKTSYANNFAKNFITGIYNNNTIQEV